MIIHKVSPSDTIYSIAKQYSVPEIRIITDNRINPSKKLTVGQSLIICKPIKTCTVRGGDSLKSIATQQGIDVLTLLQNNPNILRDGLTLSQTLNISYGEKRLRQIAVSAYTGMASVDEIESCLPFVSILIVQNRARINDGDILISNESGKISELAKSYRAIPILSIECLDERGIFSSNCYRKIFDSPNETEKIINNIVTAVNSNGFSGVEFSTFGVTEVEKQKFADFYVKLYKRCKENHLLCTSSLIPINTFNSVDEKLLKNSDFSSLWNYIWDDGAKPSHMAPLDKIEECIENEIVSKNREKILLGIPTFGVDYLKNTVGVKKNVVNTVDTLNKISAEIIYDDAVACPYIKYEEKKVKNNSKHVLYFEDASSISEKMKLVEKYNLYGINIMSLDFELPQLWHIINQMYDILKY